MGRPRGHLVYYAALAASFVLGLATLWCVDYLPTNDGPQHLFLGHAENLYGDPSTIYHQQFVPELQLASRGFALWYDPLEPLLGFRDATRVVLSIIYSWTFAGYVLLVHALGPTRRWLSLLGCGVPLCWPLYMGFFPYCAGLGIGLLLLGYVAHRPTFERRAAMVVAAGLSVGLVHHAFSVVPTTLCLCILVSARGGRAQLRERAIRLAFALSPVAIALALLWWFRPKNPSGLEVTHWEPVLRRMLIVPRVLWSGSAPTRWLGNLLVGAALVSGVLRFRRTAETERAYVVCACIATFLLLVLPIVIPGWQFFNVRFAPFVVVFALPLLPLESLRRPVVEAALCAACAACFFASAVAFHRSLREACADDLSGLSLPIKRVGFRFPAVLEPFCGLPRDATRSPVPFLGPARQLTALYATAQGGTIPNAFATVPAIHPFTPRRGADAPRVPIPDAHTLQLGEDTFDLTSPGARRRALHEVAIFAQWYDDVLLFGAIDDDVTTLGELGFRTVFRQGTLAMMQIEGCKAEVVLQPLPGASVISVGGGLEGRPEIMWEHAVKPAAAPEGELVTPVSLRLCGPGWIRVRYQTKDAALPCAGSVDGTIPYVAKRGEVTRVRCAAPVPRAEP